MTFESKQGRIDLPVSRCPACNVVVWPKSEFCSLCLGDTVRENGQTNGTILAFSSRNGSYFCVAEMGDSLRIVGRLGAGMPRIGQPVRLCGYGIRDGRYFFDLELAD